MMRITGTHPYVDKNPVRGYVLGNEYISHVDGTSFGYYLNDEAGKIRIRIDPPDKVTQYPHVHVYDNDGNLLDSLGNIVDRKSPDGHIPYKN